MANPLTSHRIAVRRVTAAQIISIAGTEAAEIALLYAVYQRTRSAAWVAAALLLTFGTMAIATPLAGSLGDRFDRRVVMVASHLGGAAGLSPRGVRPPTAAPPAPAVPLPPPASPLHRARGAG